MAGFLKNGIIKPSFGKLAIPIIHPPMGIKTSEKTVECGMESLGTSEQALHISPVAQQ